MKQLCNSCAHMDTVHPSPEQAVHICRGPFPRAELVQTPNGPQLLTVWPQINPDVDRCGGFMPKESDDCEDPGVPQ